MKQHKNSELEELEELLRRAEEALDAEESDMDEPDAEDEALFPEDEVFEEDPSPLYRNFANGYGENIRNYANGYGAGQRDYARAIPPSQPRRAPAPPAYSDYEDDYDDQYDEYDDGCAEEPPRPKTSMSRRAVLHDDPAPKHKKKRRKRRGCGCLPMLLVLLLVIIGGLCLFIQPPKSDDSIGARKSDTATILICGTDKDGTRTDTMMLLYLSGSERQCSLLSLPRDTYTLTSSGNAAKLNSAYGRNGTGEAGMDVLLDYVRDIIGYRPDGYILVDFTLVPQVVDIMGGVDVEVPMDMDVEGIVLSAGYQHLSGEEVLALLRYRKGYATADLGRIEVQRTVLKACLEQWLSVSHIRDAMEAISVLESGSISTLSTGNYLWMAKALALGLKNFRNDTLPGYADYRGGVSYYILSKSEVTDLINNSYNPYQVTITAADLNIAG